MQLAALYRYPLKSAIGESLERVWADGLGLAGDRRWMLVDAESGRFLTQRVLPQMTQLLARWQGEDHLRLSAPGMAALDVAIPGAQAPLRQVSVWKDDVEVPDAGDPAQAPGCAMVMHGRSPWRQACATCCASPACAVRRRTRG